MLRIRYKNRETVFLVPGIKKRDAAIHVRQHRELWAREQLKVDGKTVTRDIPKEDLIAEWQDGDEWNPAAPVEVLQVP